MDTNTIKIPNPDGRTQCIAFTPDGRHLITGEHTSRLRKWDISSGNVVTPGSMTANGSVYAVAVSADGRWIVSGDLGNKVLVWDAMTSRIMIQIMEHTDYVYAVDVASDSARFASGSKDCTVRVFDIMTGFSVLRLLHHASPVIDVKFSPDGSRIATVTYPNTTVGIYDAQTGDKLSDILVQGVYMTVISTPLAWSPDGQQVVAASKNKITVICLPYSRILGRFIHYPGNTVSIATHDRFVACSAGSSISLWDYTSHTQVGNTIHDAKKINCIAVSQDGKYLACGHDNEIVIYQLYDLLFPLGDDPRRSFEDRRVPLMQLSDPVLKAWMHGNSTDVEALLSEEIAQGPNPSHYTHAARSLVRVRLEEWRAAVGDAEVSLRIKQSPIGQIARSLALIGTGSLEDALDDFDLVFRAGDSSENTLLLVIKSILVFISGKHKQALSRLDSLIAATSEETKDQYLQVLGNMYLRQRDYEKAVETLELAKLSPISEDTNPLTTISLIFDWNFDNLKATAWRRLCESLYFTGRVMEVGETLLKMVSSLAEDEKELAHGRILAGIVTSSGQVTLLSWTGKSSTCNSCLPSSPAVYGQAHPPILQSLDKGKLEKRVDELCLTLSLVDALVIYGRLTRLQSVRFSHFRLLLPCIAFRVRSITMQQENTYHAETTELGVVEITTADSLSLEEPQRLVLADLRIHDLLGSQGAPTWEHAEVDDAGSPGAELVHDPIIEELPATSTSAQVDTYMRALQLIAHLGQPFNALLLLRQPDGVYKRVAADHEIVVGGMGNSFPKDIRVEVLDVL